MARLVFTAHLAAVVPRDEMAYHGATLGEALHAAFRDYPALRPYILDDQGRVRRHIAIFLDGELRPREEALALPVTADSEVYVLQALSGG